MTQQSPYYGAGIEWADGLEAPLLEHLPQMDCIEVIPENFFDGAHKKFIKKLAESGRPVAIHGVELSIGTIGPVNERHLDRMLAVAAEVDTKNFSEHLSITEAAGIEIGALTPLLWTETTCDAVCRNIDLIQSRVQARLGVPFLIENVANRFVIPGGDMSEAGFINRVMRRTGCSLLLDVTNLYTNAVNFHFDPIAWLDEVDLSRVVVVHLAGGKYDPEGFLNDSHDNAVPEGAWDLYKYVCDRVTPQMTIIERTSDYPPFAELLAELARADAVARAGDASLPRTRRTAGC